MTYKQTTATWALAALAPICLAPHSLSAQYVQTNLVSNAPGHARYTDPNLINGWGLAFFPHGPFWVADTGTGHASIYGPHGKQLPLVVSVPAAPGEPPGPIGTPAGLVTNSTSEFIISKDGRSAPALFLFDTLDGTILGWNPIVDPLHAVVAVDFSKAKPGRSFPASYYALTIAKNSSGQTILYAADGGLTPDINNNEIDMFDGKFNYLGSFTDPNPLPAMFVFGVQALRDRIYVTLAGFDQFQGGAVDVFTTEGRMIRRLTGNLTEGPLQAPWGLVFAPHDFGVFSNALLVGNVQGGRINAFDPRTGAFLGYMKTRQGDAIEIDGLWGMVFGTDARANGRPNELYFAAGPTFPPNTAEYTDGLFGQITAVGEDAP